MKKSLLYYVIKILQFTNYGLSLLKIHIFYNGKYKKIREDTLGGYSRIANYDKQQVTKAIRKNGKFSAGKKVHISLSNEYLDIIIIYKSKSILTNMSNIAANGIDVYSVDNNKYCWEKSINSKEASGIMVEA